MSGRRNTPPVSEFRGATSWGRTRTPKGLDNDSIITNGRTAAQVVLVGAGELHNALDSDTAGENGYSTENQRFLHILIEDDNTDETLTLHAYNYAFGKWAPLYIPVGAGATATANWVLAQWAAVAGKKQIVVPIDGVDRIAFIHNGGADSAFKVFAACSTF